MPFVANDQCYRVTPAVLQGFHKGKGKRATAELKSPPSYALKSVVLLFRVFLFFNDLTV